MNKDCIKLWNNCLELIKKQVTTQAYETWFKPIVPHKYHQNTLTISVPNQFFYEWLEGNYVNLLRNVIHQHLGPQARLNYQIATTYKRTTQQTNHTTKNTHTQNILQETKYLNPKFTFQHFIVGDSNQLPQAAAQAVANNPGKTAFNPVLIHSNIGLGKTHLAQAIIQHITQHQPAKKSAYVTAEKFTAQFIQKVRENKTQNFIEAYATLDLLVVDDIQFLGNKEKTQEIFFNIFNILHQKNKQIVMTSDAPPSDLQGFEKRLLSRFKWGLTVDIKKPDLETRTAIIHSKLKQHNFHLNDNIIHHIATNITSNIRELEGILISLIASANLTKQPINIQTVQQIIHNVIVPTKPEQELNMQYLQKTVANYFNIPLQKIKNKSRKKEIVLPRQLIMYLIRRHTHQSLKAIGQMLGHKDHSTVSYACTAIRNLMKTSNHFRNQVQDIEKNIRQDFPHIA